MSTIKAGDGVLYVPGHEYHLDRDGRGNLLFHFHHDEGHPALGIHRGDVADVRAAQTQAGAKQPLVRVGGRLLTAAGHPVVPGNPLRPWKARVVQVNADGSADLAVEHPHGCAVLGLPARRLRRLDLVSESPNEDGTINRVYRQVFPNAAAPGVPHDPTGTVPHSYHLPQETS
jgi:hypothetical protein